MLLGTLGANLLVNRAGEKAMRAGYGNKRQDHKNEMDF